MASKFHVKKGDEVVVLTPCYLGRPTAQPGCTGFRLPTVDEWEYAARPDFPAPNTAPLLEGQPPSAAPLYVARTAAS